MAKRISSLSVSLGATVAPFVSAFRGAGGAVTGLVSRLGSASATILRFTGIGAAVGAVLGALRGAARGISLAAELEQTEVAFSTMLRSGTAAQAMMEQLKEFSAATPFEFPEIAASAKKLLAFGVGAADMTNKLAMLGDISAGIGAPLEDIASIYGKIKSRGQLTGETLNQMAERGIPIYAALAKEMGVAGTEVAGLVTAGKIGFKQVDATLAGLSGTGGQFSGMMGKQSQTLAGLWSTLTDNVGLAAAGMVTTIVDAFSLRDAMKGLTAGIGNIGGMLTAAVARWAPIIVGWTQSLWTTITGAWMAIAGWLRPIVSGIMDFIARNWQTHVTTTAGYLDALWNVVKSVFGVVWELVKTISSAVVSGWTWAMQALGVQTTQTGSTVGNIFQGIAEASYWLMDKFTLALNVMAYSLKNWRLALDIAVTAATLSIVRFANRVEYFFAKVIPAVATWFAGNWRDIFTDVFNFSRQIFENLVANIIAIVSSIPDLIAGNVSFADLWTPLTAGFESTLKELPKIAAREAGGLESAMAANLSELQMQFATGLTQMLADQAKGAQGATDAIAGAFNDLDNQLNPPTLPAPVVPPVTLAIDANTDDIEAVGKKAKESSEGLKAMFAGSAEAMQARGAAQFAAMLAPAAKPKAAPSVAPVPPAASRAMRDDANQTSVLTQIKELIGAGNRKSDEAKDLLATIAKKAGLSAGPAI